MIKSPKEFSKAITESARLRQAETTNQLCQELIAFVFSNKEEFPIPEAEKIMNALRDVRYFEDMRKVGNAFVLTGKVSYTIHRQFAQAEIERGNYDLARFILNDLLQRTSDSPEKKAVREHAEAKGLLGRIYKQLFVEASIESQETANEFLETAIIYYHEGYYLDKGTNIWHGINALALSCRAVKEKWGISLPLEPEMLAREIIETIEQIPTEEVSCWDAATAAEACIALQNWEEAYTWMIQYVSSSTVTPFALNSTLRQMGEIWQLEPVGESSRILQLLRDALDGKIDKRDEQAIPKVQSTKKEERDYESVFGTDTYKSLEWYMDGLARSSAVARIGVEASKGIGTGFLLKGTAISSRLGDDYVLLTNEHVINEDLKDSRTLKCEDAKVIFEKVSLKEVFPVEKIYWSCHREELDVSIVQFRAEDQKRINEIGAQSEPFPVANRLPLVEESQRVYIIGHPGGETLNFSLQDNELLDYEEVGFRIHYRAPTNNGSSGSPVFNRNWKLIGIHHKGSDNMNRLNGKLGTYKANEGVWIHGIRVALAAAGK